MCKNSGMKALSITRPAGSVLPGRRTITPPAGSGVLAS
jgi:hypothetical protein